MLREIFSGPTFRAVTVIDMLVDSPQTFDTIRTFGTIMVIWGVIGNSLIFTPLDPGLYWEFTLKENLFLGKGYTYKCSLYLIY